MSKPLVTATFLMILTATLLAASSFARDQPIASRLDGWGQHHHAIATTR
ncbi:hypothetical protein [Thiocystis violascens]|uniref:Uncharacterized protein n=1 Tax=Thiocystis violascens (strain ATCC 17096 / DSM 198 / 6111) TaxID=765911 RepID=I3YA35_THIV6|nr:hypothetical protein [Thiocystis violascens]AFL73853.1 hypothetical protein Thivi_1884 [Thiocystis violascens DSM 198]